MSDNENNGFNNNDESQNEEVFLYDLPQKKDKIVVRKTNHKKIELTVFENNSGRGEEAPENISKPFNWGACLLNCLWGVRYKKWVLLLIPAFFFIPYSFIVSIALAIWAGIKGNQWAWEEIEYRDEADFTKAQQSWVKAWVSIFGAAMLIISPFLYSALIPSSNVEQNNLDPYDFMSTLELKIPKEYFDQTTRNDNHSEFLSSNKYIIYWLRPYNTLTEKNLNYITKDFNSHQRSLKNKYVLYPDIKTLTDKNTTLRYLDIEAKCDNSICIDTWLYDRCKNGYCIINPKTQKYYKIRSKEGIIPKAIDILKKWG